MSGRGRKGFGEAGTPFEQEKDPLIKRETLELVRAYYKIREGRVRKRIFEMVKAVGATSHAHPTADWPGSSPADRPADLHRNFWPPTPRARLPAPIQSKVRPMPPDDGRRLDNRHSVQHRRKQAIQPYEEQSVRHRQPRLRGCALTQHALLMPQQHDLSFQPGLRLEWRDQDMEKQDQESDHRGLN
jgi:hypothetical protein